MRSNRVSRWYGLLVWCCAVVPVVSAEETRAQALDFFDYLGSLVAHDGEWVDPLAMAEGDLGSEAAVAATSGQEPSSAPKGNDDDLTETQR